jgi:hypothetical protein
MEDIIKKLIATNGAAISQLTRQQQQLPPPASPDLSNNSLVQQSTVKLCELLANQTCLSTEKNLILQTACPVLNNMAFALAAGFSLYDRVDD